ncbi:MAG: hypothetical protein ACRC33_10700 [Gemmataceae bacterium]
MTARTWLNRLTGLTVCLAAGCVHQGAPPASVAEAPLPRHEPVTRAAASIDPPADPVKVEMIPAPAAATPSLPAPPPPPVVAALRDVIDKHPAQARKVLDADERPNRERLMSLVRLAAGAENKEIDQLSPSEVTAALDQLHDLSRRLRPKAPLKVANVCLCQGIHGFGQYDRTADGHAYRAGPDGAAGERVQVYAEVANFASKGLADGRHETKLATALEVHDGGGRCVSKMALGTCADHSLTPRSDYFLNFQFHVPGALDAGAYTLWVVVQDVTADGPPREGRVSLPLRVRAAR